jgi:demethylmenaquinone methyltransferase/2-methoxy-6-polyprenyl-1,4-benzoquinol methylase
VIERAQGQEVFSGIATRYDTLNRILSLGREQSWRRKGVERLPAGRLLDLGAGTGAALPVFGDRHVVALDPVPEMLALNPASVRVVAVGESLPFAGGSFDAVFSAFVFRNLTSIPSTLQEIERVLRPGGKLAVIGLGRPEGSLAAAVHRAGTAALLPLAGSIVGARREYAYLHRSLDKLPPPEELFGAGPLQVEEIWRMGPLGFVYGAVLVKR